MRYTLIAFAICTLSILGCKKTSNSKSNKVLNNFFEFSLCSYDSHGEYNEATFAQNDSIFYQSGRGFIYKRGQRYPINDSLTSDEVVKKYNLKKINTKVFTEGSNYQNHFNYKDCLTDKLIKSDSGQVTTIRSKKGTIFQYINILDQPIILQIKYNTKKYRIPIELKMQTTEQLFTKGSGHSHAMFYDIDKDGKDELLIVYDSECINVVAYKVDEEF